MLGTGLNFLSPALSGAGGGGSFNPTSLTLIAAYEIWDRTSLFRGYRNLLNSVTSYRPVDKTKADADDIGTIVDKAQLPGWDGTQTFQQWLDATTPTLDFDFTSSTGWSLAGSWAITGGELQHTTATTENATYASAGIADSTFYYVEVEFDGYTSGNFNILLGGNTTSIQVAGLATTTFQCMLWSGTGGTGAFTVQANGLIGNIESIKVWEAPGNHLFATANDRGSLQTVTGVEILRTGDNDWYITDGNLFQPSGTNISGLAMFNPVDTNLPSYGGITGMGYNGTGGDSILFGNSTGLGVFTPNILIDDGTNTEDLYTAGATNNALQCAEWNVNGGTSWQVWEDNVSQGSGTPTYTVDMTAQQANNKISVGTTPAGSDTFDAWGDLYAVYWYEGDRSTQLFDHVNSNTGSQL